MKKKLFLSLLITLSTLFCSFAYANTEDNINVILNDEAINFDAKPVMQEDRILVPIRAIAEKMEFDVDWNQETQTVTLENFNTILTLQINENNITKNLKYASETYTEKMSNIELDAPAKIINERTYIPLRAVTESFGCDVDWDQDSQTAKIIYLNTYGEEVVFKDEGIEYLTKLELLLEGIDIHSDIDCIKSNTNNLIQSKIKDFSIADLYTLKLHKGALNKIQNIGLVYNTYFYIKSPNIYSLEDIKKLPNLKNIRIISQNIDDISPLCYFKELDTLFLLGSKVINLEPLTKINVNNSLYFGYKVFSSNDHSLSITKEDYLPLLNALIDRYNNFQKVINENLSEEMTSREKVQIISEWISNNIAYDYFFEHTNEFLEHYSDSKGFIRDGAPSFDPTILIYSGVCYNYATTFEIFCDILNIPCIKLNGFATGIDPYYNEGRNGHVWNVIKLENGNFYHIDTTLEINFLTSEELKNFNTHEWNEEDITKKFEQKYNSDLLYSVE